MHEFLENLALMPLGERANAVSRHVRHFRVAPTFKKLHIKVELGIGAVPSAEVTRLVQAVRVVLMSGLEAQEKLGMAPRSGVHRNVIEQMTLMGLARRSDQSNDA